MRIIFIASYFNHCHNILYAIKQCDDPHPGKSQIKSILTQTIVSMHKFDT